MGGVRNKYIDRAVERTREELEAKAAGQMAAMQAQFEEQLSRVRAEAAGEVMSRLTDVLMGMDFTSGAPRPSFKAASPAPAAPTEQIEPVEPIAAEAPAVEEEEEALVEEPWIDTPLCTSCNDCLKVNPIMFVYNETNQALIGDLSAGTFAQMVEAAELCPSKCIHPGQPWNADEPNLDELKQRAAKFN
jgi:ferredoxin